MAIFVSKKEVINNLNRFKNSQVLGGQGVFKAMVDCHTGDIQFADSLISFGWKPFEVEIKNRGRGIGFFEARDVDHTPLDSNNMDPIAWAVMKETLRVLNEITTISELSEVQICPAHSIQALPGWMGRINRFEAEYELGNRPAGTYLLRHGDEYTQVIAEQLIDGNKKIIELFVCTLTEPDDKITDLLIVRTNEGWTFYRDNPDLIDSEYIYHPTPQALLNLLGSKIQCALQ